MISFIIPLINVCQLIRTCGFASNATSLVGLVGVCGVSCHAAGIACRGIMASRSFLSCSCTGGITGISCVPGVALLSLAPKSDSCSSGSQTACCPINRSRQADWADSMCSITLWIDPNDQPRSLKYSSSLRAFVDSSWRRSAQMTYSNR